MNRQQAYNKIYTNTLNEYKNIKNIKNIKNPYSKITDPDKSRVFDIITDPPENTKDFLDKIKLSDKELLGREITSSAVGFVPGVGNIASAAMDVRNAGERALRGEWGLAALNLLGVVPYVGDTVVGTTKLARAADAVSDLNKINKVTPPTIPPVIPKTVPGKLPKKSIEIAKKGIVKNALGKVVKVASHPVTQLGIPLAFLANQIFDSDEGTTTATGTAFGDNSDSSSDMISVKAGDPGLYKLGTFSSQASPYAKSTKPSSSREFSAPGYHPFFTMPSDVATEYRRKDIDLPESKDYNLDNVYYKRAYKAVNRYLNSPHGKELNNHLNAIKSTIE